jgi:hypothetical protein
MTSQFRQGSASSHDEVATDPGITGLDTPSTSGLGELSRQDVLYRDAASQYGLDIARFVAGYERDEARRQELLQDVHVALWQSFAGFRGQCALRTSTPPSAKSLACPRAMSRPRCTASRPSWNR